MEAQEVKAEVSLVADGMLQSFNCDNCFILEKKLDRSRKWNRFFKEKLITVNNFLHILREFEIEKQNNLDLQLDYDKRTREWEDQQAELIRMYTEIQPLRERLKIAEESANEEKKLRIKHQDMLKSLQSSIEQLQAEISNLRKNSNPMKVADLEKKLASCRADNKKYKNNIECCHVEISELRSYSSNNHLQVEKLQKKLYMALCIAKSYGELLNENDEQWELVQKSTEDITETLRSQYDDYYKEQANRLRGFRFEKSLIPEFDVWVHTYDVQPIPIFKEEHHLGNIDASDTEQEAIAVEKILEDDSVKKVTLKKGKENLNASSSNSLLKKEKVCSGSVIKSPIMEKGKLNVNKNKVLNSTEKNAKPVPSKRKPSERIRGSTSLLKQDEKELEKPYLPLSKIGSKLNEISNNDKDKLEITQGSKSDSSFEKVNSAKLNESQEDEFISDSSGEEDPVNQPCKRRKVHVKISKVTSKGHEHSNVEQPVKKLQTISTKNSFVKEEKRYCNESKDSAKKEKALTSPLCKNLGLVDFIEKDLNTMSSKVPTIKIRPALSVVKSDEKELGMPSLSPSKPVNILNEILIKSNFIKPNSSLKTVKRSIHNKLKEKPGKELVSDSSDEEMNIKRRKAPVKTSKMVPKGREQHNQDGSTAEKPVPKFLKGPRMELSLCPENKSDAVNETPDPDKFINSNILDVDLHMSESETSESELDENYKTPSKNKFIRPRSSDATTLVNKNQMKFLEPKIAEKLPMNPPAFIPERVDKLSDETKFRMEVKRILEEMNISPLHDYTPYSDSEDEEIKPKRLTITARRGSQGFKPSVSKAAKEKVKEVNGLLESTNLNCERITRSKYRLSLSQETTLNKSDNNSNEVLSQKKLSSPKRKRKQSGIELSKLQKLTEIDSTSETSPVTVNNVENGDLNTGITNQNPENKVSHCSSENQGKESLNSIINSSLFDVSLSMCSDLEDSPKKPSTLNNKEKISKLGQKKLDSLFGCDDDPGNKFDAGAVNDNDSTVYKTNCNLLCNNTKNTSSDFFIGTDNFENNCNEVPAAELNLRDSKLGLATKVELSTASGQSLLPFKSSSGQNLTIDTASSSKITCIGNDDTLRNSDRSDDDCSFLKIPVITDGQSHSNFGEIAKAEVDKETKYALKGLNVDTPESLNDLQKMGKKFEQILPYDKVSLDSHEISGQSMASNDSPKKNIVNALDNKPRKCSVFEVTNVSDKKNRNSSNSPAKIEKYSDLYDNEPFDSKLFITEDEQLDYDDAHSNCSSPPHDALAMDVSFNERNQSLESCVSDKSGNGRPQDRKLSKIKNTSMPNYSGLPLTKSIIDKTGNDNASADATKPILFNFYKERIGNLDEPEKFNLPSSLIIQSNEESDGIDMENKEETVNQDADYKKMELRFIHAPRLSAAHLEEPCINFEEIKASFSKLALFTHRSNAPVGDNAGNNLLSIKNMDIFLDAINKQPSQDLNIKLQSFVRCVVGELLERDFLEDINIRQFTPESIKKCLLISRLLEINLGLQEYYVDNLINMAAHNLILTKSLRTNSLSSLTAWVMTSFFLQYRHYSQTLINEGDNLISWARTFLFDLLFHNVGTAHKAILTAVNSSGKKAFIHMAAHRKVSILEEVIFWIIFHGKFKGDRITLTTLLEEVNRKLGLRRVISENPEVLIKNIITLLTDESPQKDELSYGSSSLLLLLQWTPVLTSEAIFTHLPKVLADGQLSQRAELSAIKVIIGDIVNRCTWGDKHKKDFHQKLDAELAKVLSTET